MKYLSPGVVVDDVVLIMGILASSEEYREQALASLAQSYGSIAFMSDIVPFHYTSYYNNEMGTSILRQYVAFDTLLYPGLLADIKRDTIRMEHETSEQGCRRVNLDPGYMTQASVILATTKPGSFRVYLRSGIYAQPTLYYKDKTFQPYDWTYADYCDSQHITFFNQVRNDYHLRCVEKAKKSS